MEKLPSDSDIYVCDKQVCDTGKAATQLKMALVGQVFQAHKKILSIESAELVGILD